MRTTWASLTRFRCCAALCLAVAFGWFLLLPPADLAQTVPLPAWLANGLSNRPPLTPSTNVTVPKPATNPVPPSLPNPTNRRAGALSESDLAIANGVITENTLTLSLPGLGTTKDGPGPLTDADRLLLLALKFYHGPQARAGRLGWPESLCAGPG